MGMNLAFGIVIAGAVGAATRILSLPVPAPPNLTGVLLIAAITAGYLGADRWLGGS